MNILVLGATGFIGSSLVPKLRAEGHIVRCLVRDKEKASDLDAEILEGNAESVVDLLNAMHNIDIVYYLIHSMSDTNSNFIKKDKNIAEKVSSVAKEKKVKRIIYLGALGKKNSEQTPHLKSRHEVAKILRKSKIPVTEFRAAIIVGNGSASFEMIKYLVNRLPVMICPKWVNVRTQPIYIDDMLFYLINSINNEKTINQVIDIGGPTILSYIDMMKIVAKQLNLRRVFFSVPVLTPRLSSHWVNLVTPVSSLLASSLIESVRSETICENNNKKEIFSHNDVSFEEAVFESLKKNNN